MNNFVSSIIEALFNLTQSIGFPSYVLSIVILTVFIKVILLPLNIKQMKSTKNMQVVQPLMEELKKKYANNPQKQQEEMMKLYKDYNINPLAGCLPLLIQLPIIMVLYRGLLNFVPVNPELYTFLGVNLGEPSPNMVIPVIVAVATFLQSFATMGIPKETMQKTMLYGMPIMLGYMALKFQVGICVYWVTFSVLGFIQQVIVNKGLTPQSGAKRTQAKKDSQGTTIDVVAVETVADESASKGVKNVNTSKKKKKK